MVEDIERNGCRMTDLCAELWKEKKKKKPHKSVTCKALQFALQDGLEPTTP